MIFVRETSIEQGYVVSKYRESKDRNGRLTYVAGNERIGLINGMPVFNIDTNSLEVI